MRNRTTRICTAGLLAATLVSTSAIADGTQTQWYGSFTGLRNMPSDSEAELGTRSLGTIAGDIELSDEMGFALAVGFETRGGQRVELEAAFRSFDIEGASGARVGRTPIPSGAYRLTGDVDTWSLMVNARQVFDVGSFGPYVGGGLGFARHDGTAALAVPPLPPRLPGGLEGEESGDDTVVAYQFMAGVEFDVTERAKLFGGYRYMGTADLEIERLTASYATHAIEAGIRMRF
jgi:opacity protein-like surface antigen